MCVLWQVTPTLSQSQFFSKEVCTFFISSSWAHCSSDRIHLTTRLIHTSSTLFSSSALIPHLLISSCILLVFFLFNSFFFRPHILWAVIFILFLLFRLYISFFSLLQGAHHNNTLKESEIQDSLIHLDKFLSLRLTPLFHLITSLAKRASWLLKWLTISTSYKFLSYSKAELKNRWRPLCASIWLVGATRKCALLWQNALVSFRHRMHETGKKREEIAFCYQPLAPSFRPHRFRLWGATKATVSSFCPVVKWVFVVCPPGRTSLTKKCEQVRPPP